MRVRWTFVRVDLIPLPALNYCTPISVVISLTKNYEKWHGYFLTKQMDAHELTS